MTFALMNSEKEICVEIGRKLKNLRIKNGYSSYENFALEHELSRMQYWRIEKGLTNLTIRSLVAILNIHKISIEDFFLGLHLYKLDGKGNGKNHRKEGRTYKHDGQVYATEGKPKKKK